MFPEHALVSSKKDSPIALQSDRKPQPAPVAHIFWPSPNLKKNYNERKRNKIRKITETWVGQSGIGGTKNTQKKERNCIPEITEIPSASAVCHRTRRVPRYVREVPELYPSTSLVYLRPSSAGCCEEAFQ